MSKYKIVMEARKRGAMGVLYSVPVIVEADHARQATRNAIDKLHAAGYEIRTALRLEKIINE